MQCENQTNQTNHRKPVTKMQSVNIFKTFSEDFFMIKCEL